MFVQVMERVYVVQPPTLFAFTQTQSRPSSSSLSIFFAVLTTTNYIVTRLQSVSPVKQSKLEEKGGLLHSPPRSNASLYLLHRK